MENEIFIWGENLLVRKINFCFFTSRQQSYFSFFPDHSWIFWAGFLENNLSKCWASIDPNHYRFIVLNIFHRARFAILKNFPKKWHHKIFSTRNFQKIYKKYICTIPSNNKYFKKPKELFLYQKLTLFLAQALIYQGSAILF